MRFLILAATATQCLCRTCAVKQLSWNQVTGVERYGHTWDWDHHALIVADRGSEQPCTACQQDAPPPKETAEHLLLHIYRVFKILKAYRESATYIVTLVDEVVNPISEQFPEETEAIRTDIQRLAD